MSDSRTFSDMRNAVQITFPRAATSVLGTSSLHSVDGAVATWKSTEAALNQVQQGASKSRQMEHLPRPTKQSEVPPTDKSIAEMSTVQITVPETVAIEGTRESESSNPPAVRGDASPRECVNIGAAVGAKHHAEESLTSSLAGVGTLEFVFRRAKASLTPSAFSQMESHQLGWIVVLKPRKQRVARLPECLRYFIVDCLPGTNPTTTADDDVRLRLLYLFVRRRGRYPAIGSKTGEELHPVSRTCFAGSKY